MPEALNHWAARPEAKNVLIVDDEADILASLKSLFEFAIPGVHVRTATSGATAVRLLEEEPFDLIVSDYRMPGMDGLQFLAFAQRVQPAAPRIVITAHPGHELVRRADQEGHVVAFVPKPFRSEDVVATVRRCLGIDRVSRHHADGTS